MAASAFRSFHVHSSALRVPAGALLLALGSSTSAADLVVTSVSDSGPGSLRETIASAAPGDTILFDASLSGSTLSVASELTLDKDLTILGPGASLLALDGGGAVVVLYVRPGVTTTIQGLAIRNGRNGLYNQLGTVTLNECVFENNAGTYGGAIDAFGGVLSVSACRFASNYSFNNGGAILQPFGGVVHIERTVFENNVAAAGGGAIGSGELTMSDCVLRSNSGPNGGGLLNVGNATVIGCEFIDNTATDGAGILNWLEGTNLVVKSSTFAGNVASAGGGGVANVGQATLTNCTLDGNSASYGGALYNHFGPLWLTHTTACGNSAATGGGVYNVGTFRSKNSILADNAGANVHHALSGSLEVAGVNLCDDASCAGFTQVTLAELALAPLAANGGPVRTLALLAASVARDAALDGSDWFGTPLTSDARGMSRPQGSAHDVGAFELELDTDEDGLTDHDELTLHGTDPFDADTDDDGLLDGDEIELAGSSGCPDALDADSDGDALLDGDEILLGTMACSADTDGDGFGDAADPTPTIPGVPGSYLEARLRDRARLVLHLAPEQFVASSPSGAVARRNATSSALTLAANAVALGDEATATAELDGLRVRIDGLPSPADWMKPSRTRDGLQAEVELLIALVELL